MNSVAPPLRLAEAAAVLSLATDLAMGQPLEHGLRTAMLALRMAQAMGLSQDDQVTVDSPARTVSIAGPGGLQDAIAMVRAIIREATAS